MHLCTYAHAHLLSSPCLRLLFPSLTSCSPTDTPMHAQSDADDDERFLKACKENDLPTAKRLVTPQRVRRADEDGWQPLHWACVYGHLEVAKWLHTQGVDLNAKTNNGYTPLSYAQSNGHTAVVEWLSVSCGVKSRVSSEGMGG